MRKQINIPTSLKEAVDLVKDAYNLAYVNGAIPLRNVRPKTKDFDKEYSFSAILCYLVQQGIQTEAQVIKDRDIGFGWNNKEDAARFKQLVETAYQKSLEFNIDMPHRKNNVMINEA